MSVHFPKKRNKAKTNTSILPSIDFICEHSPYLEHLLQRYPHLIEAPADDAFAQLIITLSSLSVPSTEALMKELRHIKNQAALITALADLRHTWDDSTVMRHLSRLADACTEASLKHLLLQAHKEKKLKLKDKKNPLQNCGLVIIAVGKWGAYELNYSSDIDLMVIYDSAKSSVIDKQEMQGFYNRLIKDLARILDSPTEDGYVFRTDLRLRPDPASMPLAISLAAAETYYASVGQNWERAAMIKARIVTGDNALGDEFMKMIHTWVWRKNLDFAAIEDIHSIKRQINAKQSRTKIQEGFNVKLGHGGIREIEFFAQTQQLIFGGRQPSLRVADTLGALAALHQEGHINAETLKALTEAYLFLRKTEHRLQMQEDRQTHSLPAQAKKLETFSHFAGFHSTSALMKELQKHTSYVQKTYAQLFAKSATLSDEGNLVFTGVEDDPETLNTLEEMGFKTPKTVTAAIRGWHHGRYRALRTERARQLLTEIIPALLRALCQSSDADEAFLRFDQFLSRLASGVPVLSLFVNNPRQMEIVADVMGSSPALADYLGTHPQVLEGLLSKSFFKRLPRKDELADDLRSYLSIAKDYQDILDICRKWTREKRFHAGVLSLQSNTKDKETMRYFADIAAALMHCLVPLVEKEFATQFGSFKSGQYILLGMGGIGARQMFFDSDIDLIALYSVSEDEPHSSGGKPLSPSQYYIRLTQRLITALTAPTAEGILYNVDMRLRPSGNDGALAVSVDSFLRYQRENAWVFEHMSLLRSHVLYAPLSTEVSLMKSIHHILCQKRNLTTLKNDMRDMRAKAEKQYGHKDIWNIRHYRGGTMDILFITQYLILAHAHKHKNILCADIQESLKKLARYKLISARDATSLDKAYGVALRLQSFMRLGGADKFNPQKATEKQCAKFIQHMTAKNRRQSFKSFTANLEKIYAASYAIYEKILLK